MRKFLLVCLLLCISFYAQARENPKAAGRLSSNSLAFTENKGQVVDTRGNERPDVLFTTEVNGAKLYFRKDAISYVFSKIEVDARTQVSEVKGLYRMDLEFIGANSNVQVVSETETGMLSHFYNTSRPVIGVRSYGRLVYKNLYNNIDLVFYSAKNGGMKYDFVVRPGGNVSDIRLRHAAADRVTLEKGALTATNPLGSLTDDAPYSFVQTASGAQGRIVASQYLVKDGVVSFQVGNFGKNETLVIDPFQVVANTYLGGVTLDQAYGVGRDAQGNVSITGYTQSNPFPTTTGAHQGTFSGSNDAFVAQYGATGQPNWVTYFGGRNIDQGSDLTVDGAGNVIIAGVTASPDNIARGQVFQNAWAGGSDGFVAKFNSSGQLTWASYLGGAQVDQAWGVATDGAGDIYVGGVTYSAGFPVNGASAGAFGGSRDGFVTKVTSNGASRTWSRFISGSGIDFVNKLDVRGNTVAIVGQTNSSSIAGFTGNSSGGDDAFIASLDANSGNTNWGNLDGSGQSDVAYSVKIDGNGDFVYVGSSTGSGLASPGAFQTNNGGLEDAIVGKVRANGTDGWATYLGGSAIDRALGVAVNANNEIFVTGLTFSTNFPASPTALQGNNAGNGDAFVARFNADGTTLCDGTYYGGSSFDIGRSINANGNSVVFAGQSISVNFLKSGQVPAAQANRGGNDDAVLVWLNTSGNCGGGVSCNLSASATNVTRTSAVISVSGAVGTTSVIWSDGGNGASRSNLTCATSYSVTVTDAGIANCSRIVSVRTLDCGGGQTCNLSAQAANVTTTSVNIVASGQAGGLTYAWGDPAGVGAGASRTNLMPGMPYTVTVTDAGVPNCSTVVNFTTQSNSGAFTIQEISGDPNKLTICEEGTVTLGVANAVGTNYRWFFLPTGGGGSFQSVGSGATYTIVSGMPMQSGTYKAVDAANRESNTLTIAVNPLPGVETTPSGNAVICSGAGFAQVCGIGQVNVVYQWFGVRASDNKEVRFSETESPCFNITENGTYFLRARNVITGCVDISAPVAVTTVPGPAAPTITAGGNTAICSGNTVTLTRSNEAGFSYNWRRNGQSLGVSSTSITVSEEGVYTLQARAANGCEAVSNSVSVTIAPTPTAIVSASGGTEFCTASSITTVLTATAGAGNTYSWRRNGVEVSRGGSNVFRPTTGGVYDAIVTNVQGCAAVSNGVTVTVNPLSTPSITANGATEYCIGDNINLLISATSSPNTTYQWFRDGQTFGSATTISSIIVSAPGCYSVQTTSGVCSGTSNVICVSQTPKPTATVTISGLGLSTICEDGSINLVANSGENFMYQWYRNGFAITGATTRTLLIDSRIDKSVIGVANYTVSVGRFGCMSDQSNPLEITVYPLPTGAIKTPNGATALCIGQAMMLDASEDLSSPNANNPLELVYTWRFNGAVIPGATMNMYRAESPGRYQVEILNTRTGCRKVSDVNLTTTTPPVVTVFATGNTTFCSGGEVVLTASPMGDAYRWFRNGVLISGATMRMYTATMSGNYQAEVTVGACSAVANSALTVNVLERPSAEITIDGATDFCSNANNTVLRTQPGADSYQWLMAPTAGEMPMAIPGANMNTFNVTRRGFYWVIVTKDGCSDTTNSPIDISVRLAPGANISVNGNLTQCAGSRDLVLTALPPGANLTYQWLVGDNVNVATPVLSEDAKEAQFTPTFTGRFWVQITNARGCSTLSAPIDVKFKPIPSVRISHIPDSIVCQDGSVRMMAMASGAEPGDAYEYQWFKNGVPIDGTNSPRFSATQSGNYHVIVSAASCFSARSNQINAKVYPNPDITITLSGLNAPCDGVTLNAMEMLDHSYQWLRNGIIIPGANDFSYTTVEPGNYNVTIRNIVTGCEETSIGLTVHPNPVADAGSSIEICAGNTGLLTGSATGGNGIYNYMWMEPAGLSGTLSNPTVASPLVTISTPGTYVYSLQVTDGRGCINAPLSFVTVTVNPLPVANAGADQVVCSGDAFRLMGSATSGDGGPYTFQWAGPNGFTFTGSMSDFLQIDDAGTYIFNLTVTDGNGCGDVDQVSVEVKPEPGIIAVQYNETQLFGADQLSPKSFCFGNKLVVESTVAGDFYEWYRDGIFVQGGVDNRYTVFIGGKYTIVVSHNVAGIKCTSRVSYDVTVFPEPVAQVFPIDNSVICPGGKTLRAVEAPGYTYLWVVGASPAVAVPAMGMNTMSTYNAMEAGRYWVLVTTTEGGCQKLSAPIDLTNTTLTTNYIIGEPSRCGANDGSIQVNATSSFFPILYSVNGSAERASGLFTNLSAGSYTVRTREVGGCTAETTIVLTVMAPMNLRVDVASITSSEATVLWDQIPNGTGTTRYNVRYRVKGAEMWERTIRGINGNLQDLVDLQHDSRYQVEVQTVCSDPSVASKWVGIEFSTRANGASCEMPSDIYVNIMTAPNMVPTVYWDNVPNAACYDLEYRTVTPLGEWVLLQVNSSQNPFALVGLQPATKYEVRLRSHCTFCNGTNRSEYSPNIPFVTPGVCNPNQTVSINNGVNVVNNCGNYTLMFDGQVLPNYGFQWRINGQEIGGATTNELLVTESGDYDLVLTVGNCEAIFSNAVEVTVKPIPDVIANVIQNVSCISGGDGIIKAGCVDTDRIICNESRVDFLYRLVGDNGYDSGFQPSGIFSGLRPGTYTAFILDQNTGCTDSYSDAVFTTITSPDKARFTGAVGQNQSEARLQWTSVFGANAYVISYRPAGSTEQNWTDVLFDGGCPFPGTCDYILGGLQNNTTYEVRVQTRCAQGNVLSDWTDTTTFFTAPLNGCPVEEQSVPGGVFAVVTETSATINWNAVQNGVRYQVRYRQAGQDEDQSIVLPETIVRTQLISGLIANTSYAYDVRTICGSNIAGDWSETRFFKTLFFRGENVSEAVSEGVSVYPNPNNGQFTINFTAGENGAASIRMFDLAGKLVLDRTQQVNKGQGSVDVEMNGYASGIYMLHFTQSGVAKVIKVVIN